ncbi:MAG: cytochrome c biogenesis protein [Bdellovibrio sp.]
MNLNFGLKTVLLAAFVSFWTLNSLAQHPVADVDSALPVSKMTAEQATSEFTNFGNKIEASPINKLPVQQNGRIKPLDTLARESLLFVGGTYRKFGLDPVQTYIALAAYSDSALVEILEIRDVSLRTELGYLKNKKFYSLKELEGSPLSKIAEPLFNKQQENPRSLNEHEKNSLEAYNQMSYLRDMISGQSITAAADYSFLEKSHGMDGNADINKDLQENLARYFRSLGTSADEQKRSALSLISLSRQQKAPEIFQHYLKKIDAEILYNRLRPFFWASILAIVLGVSFLTPLFKNKIPKRIVIFFYILPIVMIVVGLGLRVYITQFAPITNMYGTMIWVAFGVSVFGLLLFCLYQNYVIPGMTLLSSGLILLLTEQMPLILSPDLDPVVAVLRSNFWLSTHVTTITISYAAFTIAMVMGNIGLIRLLLFKDNQKFFKEYSHYAYRMIQLGCFLLSMGIILGGVWADYSWGRFWGWDPKETWALIADLGFLILLHGQHIGWINSVTLLALSPLAYLLVIMAWYGVNFVLAAGLHSYGFSSGGAAAVSAFVAIQIIIFVGGIFKFRKGALRSHGKLQPGT